MDLGKLPKPFFVLAPMDDVTDTVFRQVVADCAPPDLFFTEFVNVDGLQSPGRERLLPKLRFTGKERPLIAQVWGKNPENFYKTAQDIVKMGFDGLDLNFGCPEKNVVRSGVCSAFILPENRPLAVEIIKACRAGLDAAGGASLPLSVKTRIGFNDIDLSWHELLLSQKLNMLTIHGRTKKQMSKVPADWETIGKIRELRDKLSPGTLIVGNGDVLTRPQGEELARKYGLDGIMIGRGVFNNPFVFSKTGSRKWENYDVVSKINLFKKHVELFLSTWHTPPAGGERPLRTLNKFCKIYINGFDGAKELREQIMAADTPESLLKILASL